MNSTPPIPVRSEVPEALTWDLSPLYVAAEEWEGILRARRGGRAGAA